MNPKLWRTLGKILSMVLAVAAINGVVAHSNADVVAEFSKANKPLLLVAGVLYGAGVITSSVRWGVLLRVQGIALRLKDLIRLTMIGVFWNLAMPGGVGGDLLKMVYVRKHAGEKTTEAVMTILVDRVIGLLGLLLVALVAVAFSWDWLSHAPDGVRNTVLGVAVASACGALGVMLVLAHKQVRRIPGVESVVDLVKSTVPPVARIISRVVNGLDLYKGNLPAVALSLGISMLIHSSVGVAVMLIGWAYHTQGLEWKDYFLATQMANTVSAIPLTPGGLGGRDAVLYLFFSSVTGNSDKSGVIALTLTVFIVFWSLVGGLFFLFDPNKEHQQIEEIVEDYLEQGEEAVELETSRHA